MSGWLVAPLNPDNWNYTVLDFTDYLQCSECLPSTATRSVSLSGPFARSVLHWQWNYPTYGVSVLDVECQVITSWCM